MGNDITVCIPVKEFEKHVKNEVLINILLNRLEKKESFFINKEDVYECLGMTGKAEEEKKKYKETVNRIMESEVADNE